MGSIGRAQKSSSPRAWLNMSVRVRGRIFCFTAIRDRASTTDVERRLESHVMQVDVQR